LLLQDHSPFFDRQEKTAAVRSGMIKYKKILISRLKTVPQTSKVRPQEAGRTASE
jgi:hypothetical protein